MLMKPLKELINDILNFSENKELENIKRNPTMIKEITNPTEAQQLAAVRSSSHAIKYIKEPTKKVRFIALKDDIYNYRHIKNLTAKEQLYLIKEGISIKNIQKPVEKVQLYALKWRRASISDIRNPTEKAQLITIRKDKELFLYIKNPTITVCQEVARAYCGNIEIPTDRRIIKPTQKLVSSLQDTEGYAYIKEMSLDYNKGDKYINDESDKIMNWKKQKQKQIIDDYKYEIGIAKERGIEPNIKIEESGIQQENGHKQVNTRIDYSNKPQDKYNIEALSNKEVIGTISYYDFNGKVCEVIEYNTVESYLKSIKDELNSNPNGFKYETLTTDANIRKSVDDIVYGAYGEDNPHSLESIVR